jgi:uncharacterized membrane protein
MLASLSAYSDLSLAIMALWLAGSSFWLHLATVALFAVGLTLTIRRSASRAPGLDKVIRFGRTFFAVPMAVFGMQHFTAIKMVVNGVPSWMPGHLFWVCFVGVALIAAALSLITGFRVRLAAVLVGIMLFLFVLLIYVPNLVRNPHDRFAMALPLRDLALSGGALALAGTQEGEIPGLGWVAIVGRFFFAVPMVFFGIEHFFHPEFAPGVPLPKLMPPWIPGHMIWAYLTGTILVVCGLTIVVNKAAHMAAAFLGVAFLLLVLLVYVPMEIVHPSIDISGELDYVADTLAMSGASLLVAGTLANRASSRSRLANGVVRLRTASREFS